MTSTGVDDQQSLLTAACLILSYLLTCSPQAKGRKPALPPKMNKIRAIQELNKKEIEQGMYALGAHPYRRALLPYFTTKSICTDIPLLSSPNASWHVDYRDTAFIYFGGLPYELSEGDVITIFSQYGEPVFLKLARDHETGKSKGFGWLKYEDQRSTDLAVDNLGGATIGGRMFSVDHARYKPRDDDDPEEGKVGWEDIQRREREEKLAKGEGTDTEMGEGSGTDTEEEIRRARPMLKEERELELLIEGHDDDDPMKEFMIEEKKKEVEEALLREKKKLERGKRHKSSGRHHRSHRSKRDDSDDDDDDRRRRRRGRDDEHRSRRDATPVKREDSEDAEDRRRRRRRREDEDRPRRGETPTRRDDGDRRERRRRHSSERDSRRDGDRRRDRDRDRDDRGSRRDPESNRPRREREGSEGYDRYRHQDSDRRRRRDRSKSP